MSPTILLLIFGFVAVAAGVVFFFGRKSIARFPGIGIERWFVERRGGIYSEYAETKVKTIGIISVLIGLSALVGAADHFLTGSTSPIGGIVLAALLFGTFVTVALYFFRLNGIIR